MKRLTCVLCGSTDLIKDGGVFVCQTCGCKYSVEEARKMMVEGTVDIRGTVQVDNSAFVQKYLENARRAKEKEDWEETEKYYNMVEQNDPNNIEAIFYSAYGKAKSSLVDSDIYKREAVFKVLCNCISIIDDKYSADRGKENETAILSMAADLSKMLTSNFVFTEWKNGYGVVTKTNKGETYTMFGTLLDAFRESVHNIARVDDQEYLHLALILLFTTGKLVDWPNKKGMASLMDQWIAEERASIETLKKARAEAYWVEHPEEKARLDGEKAALLGKADALKESIASLPELEAVQRLEERIQTLQQDRDALGLFKLKEKKALQEQIDALSGELSEAKAAQDAAAAPLRQELDALQAQITQVDDALMLNQKSEA